MTTSRRTGSARPLVPSPARTLELLAVGHGAVGLVLHRRALTSMVRSGLVASVDDHGPRATAWWFLTAAPLLWVTGQLLRATTDDDLTRRVGVAVAAVGSTGVVVMPRSPFWILAATGVRIAVRGRPAPPPGQLPPTHPSPTEGRTTPCPRPSSEPWCATASAD